ncbi:MAG: hypothetical protein KGJ13_11365 [Patescibacteria group bacterium]|nr:hypothetical protein [Patescibacteria group bacterium]
MKKILGLVSVLMFVFAVAAQTNTPTPPSGPGDLINTVVTYLDSINTNLDVTFGANRFDLWSGISSMQGGPISLVNDVGFSGDLLKISAATNSATSFALSLENVFRNSGVAGTLTSEQAGVGFSAIIHDLKLTAYADGGNRLYDPGSRPGDRWYCEVGFRVKKAMGTHFYSYLGMFAQFPNSSQGFSAGMGATF